MSRVGGVVLGDGLVERRLPWRSVALASLDLETTGLDPTRDEILSFGVVPIEAGRVRLDLSAYRLVRPTVAAGTPAVAVHRILPAEVEGAERLKAVGDWLRASMWRRVLVGWASWVEGAFLSKAMGGRPHAWERHIIDVRRLVGFLATLEGRGRSTRAPEPLALTAARFGIPPDREHHALWDAFVTAQLFVVVASMLERHGVERLGQLLRAGRPRLGP